MLRGEGDHVPVSRLRMPETLSERGREELTGTNGNELPDENGSNCEACEFVDVEADMFVAEGVAGGIRTCDCDIGVSSPNSMSAFATDDDELCTTGGTVGVRSGS